MDLRDVIGAGMDQAGAMFAAVEEDRLGAPTPCSGWDVRALINHVVAANTMFAAIAGTGSFDLAVFESDLLGDDRSGALDRALRGAREGWLGEGALDRTYVLPWPSGDSDLTEVPGETAAGANLIEMVVHAWDLSRATGQPFEIDDDVVAATLDLAQGPSMDIYRAQPGEFDAAGRCGSDASAADRLAALLGRRP